LLGPMINIVQKPIENIFVGKEEIVINEEKLAS
jgi:hypothetical protein